MLESTLECKCKGRLFYKKIATTHASYPAKIGDRVKDFIVVGYTEETLCCRVCGCEYEINEDPDEGIIRRGKELIVKTAEEKEFKDWPGRQFKVAELYNKMELLAHRVKQLNTSMDRLQDDFHRLMETDMLSNDLL